MVVLRELDLPADEQVRVAREIMSLVSCPVLVARDPEVARRAGAAGVQLGWTSPTAAQARDILGPEAIVGVSVHSIEEGRATGPEADYLLFGPIYPTPKPHGLVFPVGVVALRKLASEVPTPVVAIGGIDLSHEPELVAAGAAGIAAIRAFMAAGREPEPPASGPC
jgi:thiamine-phosphate pyrophosphorylase